MPLTSRITRHAPTLRAPAYTRPRRWQRTQRSFAAHRGDRSEVGSSNRSVAVFRIAFAVVWMVDATLKWLPGFRSSFGSMLDQAAKGQPGLLRPWFDLWTGLPHEMTTAMAYGTAITETLIALALVFGFARKSLYAFGAVYAFLVWATAEGFGGPYQSGSTDIGAAIIYSFVFVALLIVDRPGPDPYSVDAYLETRISWWSRVAEVGPRRARAGVPIRSQTEHFGQLDDQVLSTSPEG